MIGQTLDDRYRMEVLIGRGGMGSVYRAVDLVEDRVVALKLLHHFLDTESKTAFNRFYREFRVLTQLDHPRIVRAYGYGTHEGVPYLALEFLAGRTLTDELADGPLLRSQLLLIARQICEALIHLHERSIVHRDLKPGNLMLLSDSNAQDPDDLQVKLMDFGLVRLANPSIQLTQEGMALGTVAYMSPEQAQGFSVDFRTDLYALGVVLYEMSTGRLPFVHENPAMMLMQQLTTSPLPPRQVNPYVDEALEQLILDLLAKEPAQRPASTDQVAAHLAELAHEDMATPVAKPSTRRADLIPRIPLIGREVVLSQLTQAWANARTGLGQVILLTGVAGAGKTRLLTEASLPARIGDDRFVSSNCREHTALPYQPFIDILIPLLNDLPEAVKESLPAELTRLLSGMADASNESVTLDQAEAQLRLFAAFWEVLRQSARDRALMLVIEDGQWADPTTLELFGCLADQVKQAHILLILTYRSEEVESGAPLATLQRDLLRSGTARTLTLDLLNRDQVTDFLKAALGREDLPPWLIDSFQQATDGNPLFMEETLKALAAEGQVAEWMRADSSQWRNLSRMTLQLPQNVLALAERRLQMLSAEDRPILTAAAVLGPEFSFTLLQGITKLDEDTLLDAIDRLLAARLIEELPLQDREDRYRFGQEALRQALLSTISQRRLRRLHRRTSEMIQELYDTSRPRHWPTLAYHFAEAGDEENALKYFILAGDAAADVYALPEALAHYGHALKFTRREVATDDQLISLFSRRGRTLELCGLYDDALTNYQELENLAREQDSHILELAALIPQATLRSTYTAKFDPGQGRVLSERALVLAQDLNDSRAEAKVLWNLMLLEYYGDKNPEQARTYGEQALVIAREQNLREELAYILNDLVGVYVAVAQMDRAWAAQAEACQLWRELNNLPMLADSLLSSAEGHYMEGRPDEAMSLAEEALRISQSSGNVWGQVRSMGTIGPILFERGKLGAAIKTMEEALPLAEQANFAIPLSVHIVLAWFYSVMGNMERGFELARFALSQAEEFGRTRAYALAMLAKLHMHSGDPAKAETLFQEALSEMDADQSTTKLLYNWFLYMVGSEVTLANQSFDDALTLIERTIESTRTIGIRPFLTHLLFLESQVLLGLNRIEQAHEVLVEALAESTAEGSYPNVQRFQVLHALSKVEIQRGNITEVELLREEAREIVTAVAENIDDLTLRDSFLATPPVPEIMELS